MDKELPVSAWPEWKIVEKIGEGSYGKVYKAQRCERGKAFYSAIKIITIPSGRGELEGVRAEVGNDQSARAYFQNLVEECIQEVATMEYFRGNSHIVSVEDFKVMEYLDEIGWDISIRMEYLTSFMDFCEGKNLTESEVIRLGRDLSEALEYCRKLNIIHRDVKPENIFLSRFGDFKLGDFGIARELERAMGSLSKKGTYSYMAPEMYRGEQYDSRVDIYSLGLVLYKLMNHNRLPFLNLEKQLITYRDKENALARRMSGEMLPRPVDAEEDFARIILKACAYDPQDRYQTPEEMTRALEDLKYERYRRKENPSYALDSGKNTEYARASQEAGIAQRHKNIGKVQTEAVQPSETHQTMAGRQFAEAHRFAEGRQSAEAHRPSGGHQSVETHRPLETRRSSEGSQSAEMRQSLEVRQSAEMHQPTKTRRSSEGHQSTEAHQSLGGRQSAETRRSSEGHQSTETHRSSEGHQSTEARRSSEGHQSTEARRSSEVRQSAEARQPSETRQSSETYQRLEEEAFEAMSTSEGRRSPEKRRTPESVRKSTAKKRRRKRFSPSPWTIAVIIVCIAALIIISVYLKLMLDEEARNAKQFVQVLEENDHSTAQIDYFSMALQDIKDHATIIANSLDSYHREGEAEKKYVYYDDNGTLMKMLVYPQMSEDGLYEEYFYWDGKLFFAYIWSDADHADLYYYEDGKLIRWIDQSGTVHDEENDNPEYVERGEKYWTNAEQY